MPLAKELVQGGFSAGQAVNINGGQNTALAAAGTTASDATPVATSTVMVTSGGAGAGVILPSCQVGDSIVVYNAQSAVTLLVYPDTGSTINNLTANTPGNIAARNAAQFRRVTSTAWVAFLSA